MSRLIRSFRGYVRPHHVFAAVVGFTAGYAVNKNVWFLHNAEQQPLSLKSKVLDEAALITQHFKPINKIHQHVCGFHFYSDDMKRQLEAHHYCSHLNDEVRQCVIYDSEEADAKLIGIEYIISARLFQQLPEEEKKYWHSHVYEVKSGTLTTPMTWLVPGPLKEAAEIKELETVINTYGKTFHTWQVDRGDPLPYGPAKLMMAFTQDNQLDPKLVESRDKRYGISVEKKKSSRAHIKADPILPGADSWESGMTTVLVPQTVKFTK